jgi:imidazole glycerol-phosphate synthase subunit HisF
MTGLARRIIACLDVRDGRVVKGINFVGLRDSGDPAELAARYNTEGIDEVVILDITASVEQRIARQQTVSAVAARLFIPLTVGGGITSLADADAVIEAGADKVAVNTAALANPELISQIAGRYGNQAVIAAIDARLIGPAYVVHSHGGRYPTARGAVDWAREAVERGAGEILLTSMDADGTRAGFDLELTAAVSTAVGVPVIASGGAGEVSHFAAVFVAGHADAALAASVFHEQTCDVSSIKRCLRDQGIPVRL